MLCCVVAFALALAGAHGVSRWMGILPGIVAALVTATLMDAVEDESRFAPVERSSHRVGPQTTSGPGPGVSLRIRVESRRAYLDALAAVMPRA